MPTYRELKASVGLAEPPAPVVDTLPDEAAFRAWYTPRAQKLGIDPNPDNPLHFYDYRAAYKSGAGPDSTGHWPSQFKREGHPRMVLDGVNTKTGERVAPQPTGTSYRALKASLGLGMAPNPQPVHNAPGSTLTQSIAPVDTPTATNDIFVGRGTMAPGISAQPRGPKMTIPERPGWVKALDPAVAFTGSAVEAFARPAEAITRPFVGGIEEGLESVSPGFGRAKAQHPIASSLGELAGSLPLVEAAAGATAGIPGISAAPGAVREAVTGALYGLAATRDPEQAAQDAAMFGLLGGGVRVAGQGLGKVFPGIRAKVPAERTAERTTEPPKPARGLPPEPTPVSEPPLPIIGGKPEGARQLGKSEAEAFPALPTEKLPAAQVEPQAAAPEPVRPTMPAAKAPSPIDPAVKHEALKADREHFQKQGLDRGEANRAAEQLAEGDFVGLSKEEGAKIRRQFDMDKLSPAEREARLRVVSEVKSAGTDSKAIDIADDVLANERAITRHEHAAMELKAAELVDVYDQEIAEAARLIDAGDDAAAALARGRADVVFDQVDRLTRAADTGGRELARDFGFRRTMIDKNTMDLARVMQRAKVAKGSRLTPQETSRIEEVISELKRVEAENVRLTAEHGKAQAALEKARAEGIVARIAKRKTIMEKAESSREGLRAQRDDIKKQIAALGFRLNDVTGVSAEASYLIGKLAVNYAREGATNLDEVVRLVLNDIPGLTARDVHESLNAKNPKMQARARAEVEKRIGHLKTQARLLTALDDAERGVFADKAPHLPKNAPADLQALRKTVMDLRAQTYRSGMAPARVEKALKQISELQDQLDNHYRAMKKQPGSVMTEELTAARDKIKQLRRTMKVEDDLSDLQEQLRTGDFKVPEPREATKLPPELERNTVELGVMRKKVRAEIASLKPRTGGQKIGEAINTMRTVVASGDMSGAFRQGFIPTARMLFTNPMSLGKIEGQAFKSFFDSYTADAIDAGMRAAPQHYVRQKAGLFLPEIGVPAIKGEELYLSDLAHRVPVLREGVKASERHMVTVLNLLRAHRFDSFLEKFPNATSEELKAMATWINVSSGRGDMGKYAAALDGLSTVVFAPRFAWSRIQTPYQLVRYWHLPRVRNEIAKDLAATVALGTSVLTAAKLSGLEVGDPLDPNSPDWGKIKVGNTRFDIFAGFQQPARLVARLGTLAANRAGIGELSKQDERLDPLEMIGRFSSYKAAPVVSVAKELLTGKDMVGQPVTPLSMAGSHLLPLFLQDIYDAYKDDGVSGRTAAVGAAAFLGIGASTYENKKKSGMILPTIPRPKPLPGIGAARR